jgi:hypothetical protein
MSSYNFVVREQLFGYNSFAIQKFSCNLCNYKKSQLQHDLQLKNPGYNHLQ